MPIIYSYPTITTVTDQDLFVISKNGSSGPLETKNIEAKDLVSYFYKIDVLQKDVTITSTQLLSLNGGGTVEVLAAPGSGKMLSILNAVINLDYGSVAYNFAAAGLSDGVGLELGTTGLVNDNAFFTSNLNSAADTYFVADPLNASAGTQLTPNVALNLVATSGISVSQGNSPVKMSILYREITLP